MRRAALAAAIWACALRTQAASGPGTAVAPILQLGVGARAAGMGDNFVALADDVHASAWNPAGLAFVSEKSASLTYLKLFDLINYSALSFAVPVGERGGWGGHILYAYTDAIPQTTEDAGGNFNPASGGAFRNSDLKANLSGGYALTSMLSLGVGGSVFQDAVGNDTVTGFFGDFGAFLKPHPWVTASAGVQNVGPKIRGNDSAPALARAGAAFRRPGFPLLSLETDFSFADNRPAYGLGSEYWIADVMAVRAGLQLGNKADSGGYHYSLGAGFKLGRAQVDYAFSPMGVLGQAHRIGLTVKFGDARRTEETAAALSPQAPRAAAVPAPADPFAVVDQLITKKRLGEALKALTASADAFEGNDQLMARYHQRMGLILYAQGRAREAQSSFSESLRIALKSGISDPAVASAYVGVGLCLMKKGDGIMAGKFFAKGLESNPDAPTRALIEAQLKKLEKKSADAGPQD